MNELADGKARLRILTEFGTTFFVEAAAGTGKPKLEPMNYRARVADSDGGVE
jgi:hypothetical protein